MTRVCAALVTAALLATRARAAEPIELVGALPIAIPEVGGFVTDVWGWVHPTTLREYAIVGTEPRGIHIVDVTDASNPVLVKYVDTVPGFDMVTWNNYLYVVDGGSGTSGTVLDITDPANPAIVGILPTAHSVSVSAAGTLWLNYPSLRGSELSEGATTPTFWFLGQPGGHDVTLRGSSVYDYAGYGAGCRILRLTAPRTLTYVGTCIQPGLNYYHSGDRSADQKFLYVLDELAFDPTPDITVFDIDPPTAPVVVNSLGDPTATAHNLLVKDNVAYVSYYTAGFKAFNIADPANPSLIGAYDTAPETGECYCAGAYGVYPFAPSGVIYVSDWNNGLLLFRLTTTVAVRFTNVAAAPGAGSVVVSWELWSDEAIAGFRVYRRDGVDGRDLPLSGELLPATTRAFRDDHVTPGARYRYLVTAQTSDGDLEVSAPVTVVVPEVATGITSVRPNPFRPRTTIDYTVEAAGAARLDIFDARGARVRTLVDRGVRAGPGSTAWDGTDANGRPSPSGVYFARLTAGKRSSTHRMVLLK